ncbi:alpha/beta hydrolase [Cellulomonas fimi]|uniref:Alpha/beta hydrolase n=1 Tax=Cellulomonas fimi TaxID=1708 RepID=A0A7Y0QGD2_CELFI|nr:alpha/beta hydrolase [Cellulomonas fimi]NMR19110.1 alpha/beta hydrolase [Cellulomonas fimi]
MPQLLPGLEQTTVVTSRARLAAITRPDRVDGQPVLFVHGNVSSSLFWQQSLLDVPEGYRPLAVDLRGFGDSEALPVDATRGVRDYSDDLAALVEALELGPCHLVGWSMGGGVTLQYLRDRPDQVRSLTLVNPVSPYGFGATRGLDGDLTDPDAAGAGGGSVNPEFVRRLAAHDTSADDAASPRRVLLSYYVKPPFVPELLDVYVESMLSTHVADGVYPGDSATVPGWPGFGPGPRGVLNTMAPTYFRIDDLHLIDPKPPIAWFRGAADQIVSDTSAFDLAHLGSLGVVPGWPGADVLPAQPMVAQTRAVLERYGAAGGRWTEVVFDDAGHSPHLEAPADFAKALAESLDAGR